MPSTPTPPAVRHPRRWWRRGLLLLVCAIVLLAAAPLYSGPVLRRVLERQLEQRLEASASVRSVAFAWPARLRVRGLELADPRGELLASLDELSATLGLGALLAGRLEAEVQLSYPEVHLYRTDGGEWNWQRVLAKARARRSPRPPREPGEEEVAAIQAHLALTDGHVIVHGPGGETTLGDIALEVRVDGLERPAPFHLGLAVRGPKGPAGGLSLAGSFTAAPGGRLDPLASSGEVRLELDSLDLAAFAPALALFVPVEGLGGVLNGSTELRLGSGLALTGTSAAELRDLTVLGPRSAGHATRIERLELSGSATQDESGAGTQRLELRAESCLSLVYAGRSSLRRGTGTLDGRLTASAELGRLAELARAWVPFQEGVTLAGQAEYALELDAVLAAGRPTELGLALRGGIEGLAARAPDGQALDLAELRDVALELEARADFGQGLLAVPTFALRAGPLTCSGRLEAGGIALAEAERAPVLRSGALDLQADLERLRGILAAVLALDGAPFGGRVEARLALAAEQEALQLDAQVDARALVLADTRLAEARGTLRAGRATGGKLSGSGELTLGPLTLALEGREPLTLPGAAITLDLAEDAAGEGVHRLELATVDGALRLGLDTRSARHGAELELRNVLALNGDVGPLAALAAPFVPLQPGLAGALAVHGDLQVHATGLRPTLVGGKLELELDGLAVVDAAGASQPLEALAAVRLALEGELDARAGRLALRSLALHTGSGLALSASGTLAGLAPGARLALEDGRMDLEVELDGVGRELERVVDLGGWTLAGSPLTAAVRCATAEQRIQASGRLAAAALRLTRPGGEPIALADLGLDFDLGYDLDLGSLHVRRAALASRTGSVELLGTLNQLGTPAEARGAMRLSVAAELERVLGDLGLETPECGRRTAGAWRADLSVEGDRGTFRVAGRTAVERFRLEVAPETEGEPPLRVEEPSIALDLEARVVLATLDVELTKLALTSDLARGGAQGRFENLAGLGADGVRFRGVTGHLAYVPDRLGAVLAPLLPGKLGGAEEERLTFTLDGTAKELDLASLLASSQAHIDLGIGRFERPEIQLTGKLALEAKEGRLALRGDLGANGGTLQIDGVLVPPDGDPAARSRLILGAKEVRVNAGLAPLLAHLHPAFATAELAEGSLGGVLGLNLDVTYDAPLALATLAAGWEALPKTPVNGTGRLVLVSAELKGSPLLALLEEFGVDTGRALDLRPIEFTIQKGRVTYAKPWTWTFAGTQTTFTGSLGLDQSLDLDWNVPVSERLVERWSFLEALRGETLTLPLRGSVKAPKLEADATLKELAAKLAKQELGNRLGLGEGRGEDPSAILVRADALWSQGKKSEAAALYERLREDFKLSLTYALNKDRIKDRSRYKDPPR